MIPRRFALLALPAVLAGCHLLDRGDIPAAWGGARPERMPAPPPPPPPPPGPPPLVTIRFTPGLDYRPALARAVAAARRRKPDVVFDVVTMVPAKEAQTIPPGQETTEARQVADAMVQMGVRPANLRLQARIDPSATEREVRVYIH